MLELCGILFIPTNTENEMTERKAATLCNHIYKALSARQIERSEASKLLSRLEPYMSGAQLCKYLDFLGAA